jgi:hypothetical protein
MRELLRDYARQTRAGNRGTAAAWHRLQRTLEGAATKSAPRAAVAPPGWTRARWVSAAFAAAVMLWIAGGVLPSRAASSTDLGATARRSVSGGAGGGVGLGGAPGCGGAEGSSGNHAVRGETAAASMPRVDPSRAG